jgi:hypothetical protein
MEGRANFGGSCSMDEDILRKLEERLGPLHARQRLGIETDHEAKIFGQSLLSFHIVNWYPVHSVIRNALKLTGLYWRGRRNTGSITGADAEIQEAFSSSAMTLCSRSRVLVYHIRGTTSRHWHGHILENNHRHVTNSDVGLSGVGPTAQLRFRAQSS